MLRNPNPKPQYAYIAPTYSQAKRVVWSMLKEYTQHIPGVEYNEADLRVDIPHNKARIMLLSAETPDSLRGLYLDGVIFDEFASQNPKVFYEVVRPTLSDRKGWAIFISTPAGENAFYDLYRYATKGKDGVIDPEWFGAIYRASETGIISKEELDSARRAMDEDSYNQEYEVSFSAALSGAYFGKEITTAEKENRITQVPHDPALPVETAWDLGISDTTAVWFFQTHRTRTQVIDYYEVCGASLPEIVKEVTKRPYQINSYILPHDAEARDLSTGKTRKQIMYSLGCRNIRVIPRIGVKAESINAARIFLARCWFDATKCEKGLKALSNYQRRWNDKNNCYENSPLHNWASNGADAFQQMALGARDDSRDSGTTQFKRDRMGGLVAETEYNLFTL